MTDQPTLEEMAEEQMCISSGIWCKNGNHDYECPMHFHREEILIFARTVDARARAEQREAIVSACAKLMQARYALSQSDNQTARACVDEAEDLLAAAIRAQGDDDAD